MHRFFWFMLNAQRSALRHLIIALLVTGSVGLGLTGCDFGGGGGPSFPTGMWEAQYDSYEIDTRAITYNDGFGGGYTATVISINEYQFNAGDTTIAQGAPAAVQPGFAVIRYTAVDGPGTGEVGKYNIFRWAEDTADPTQMLFAQGYKNVGDPYPNNINGVFDTAVAAVDGATNADGYFPYAGSYAR